MKKPILHNVRILDFTWVMAGPYATRLLADYGAEVIKVQPLLPAEEDDAFTRGYYNTWNRSKLGITLNLNKPEGIELAKKLVSISDAVIENFTPHVMANWGLDYASLKKIKPDIIMLSMSVKGQQSYYSGFAPTVHALSGLTGLMVVEGSPLGPGFSYADHIAGLYASIYLLEALEYRRQKGEGRYIDLSEVDLMKGLLKEKEPQKELNIICQCKDGKWCAVTIYKKDREGLKRILKGRKINGESPDTLIKEWASKHTAEEAVSLFQINGIAAGVVKDAADLANDPQLKARGFFVKANDVTFTDASPVRMENGVEYRRAAPSTGQDNEYVYGSLLGLSKKEMAALKEKGVI